MQLGGACLAIVLAGEGEGSAETLTAFDTCSPVVQTREDSHRGLPPCATARRCVSKTSGTQPVALAQLKGQVHTMRRIHPLAAQSLTDMVQRDMPSPANLQRSASTNDSSTPGTALLGKAPCLCTS